jgi:hypothetical protein
MSLYLIKQYAMKAYGGEWSASRCGHFTSEEGAPGIHWIGGWVDPRMGSHIECTSGISWLMVCSENDYENKASAPHCEGELNMWANLSMSSNKNNC